MIPLKSIVVLGHISSKLGKLDWLASNASAIWLFGQLCSFYSVLVSLRVKKNIAFFGKT